MGCYLLNCATLSDIIPIKCFATPGWKDYIEHMKKGAIDNILKDRPRSSTSRRGKSRTCPSGP